VELSRGWVWLVGVVLLAASLPVWAMPPAEEARLGKEVFADVRPLGLTRDPTLDELGARLAKVTQRKEIAWRFWVVEGMKEFNAFAAPGGLVFISRPYYAKLNADEAAFVLGHEMAHVDLNHHEKQMKRSRRANIGNLLLRVFTDSSVVGTVADLGATAYVTHYSRVLEREADFAGYHYAEQAGYNARAAVSALSKLGNEKQPPLWIQNIYATHPVLSSREDRLTALGGKEPDDAPPPPAGPSPATSDSGAQPRESDPQRGRSPATSDSGAQPRESDPPPSPQHSLAAGLKPLDPERPIAVRILQPSGGRWEHTWRKSFTKAIHLRLTPLGFTIAGDDLMYKPDIGDPIAAARSRNAKYLLLVTVKEMQSEVTAAAKPTGTPVKAVVELTARLVNVTTGAETWTGKFAQKAEGTDVLPTDPETLYLDTTVGGLAWKAAGEFAVAAAKAAGAK